MAICSPRSLRWLVALLLVPARSRRGRSARPPSTNAAGVEFFDKKIRRFSRSTAPLPLVGREKQETQGNLYLDSRDGILKGGDSGPSLVPVAWGKPPLKTLKSTATPDSAEGKLPDAVIAGLREVDRDGCTGPARRHRDCSKRQIGPHIEDGEVLGHKLPVQPKMPVYPRSAGERNRLYSFLATLRRKA